YQYDTADRLTNWERGPEGGAVSRFERYAYDAVGNRKTLTAERGVVSYGYDTANRLLEEVRQPTNSGAATTTTYGWDDNGNMTSKNIGSGTVTTYSWDPLDRMTGVTGPAGTYSYGYDPTGIRFRETNNTAIKRFLLATDPQGFGDIVEIFGGGGTLETYVSHGIGVDEPLAQVGDGGTNYLHCDGLGSVTALSAASGQMSGTMSYAPFGEAEQRDGVASRYGFTGRELDPTGLMYYRTRLYSPDTGRFASRDPFRGSILIPSSHNGFAYVSGNPVRLTDPSGLFAF